VTAAPFPEHTLANTTYSVLRAHKYSSYVFSAFLTAHITNTSLIPLYTRSVQGSSKYLLLTRPYYQSWPLAEPLIVISPLLVHLVSGIALRIYRRQVLLKQLGAETRGDRRTIAWPKLSGTSVLGYFAVPLVLGHTAINRMLPLWVDGGSSSIGLDFVSHGLNVGPTWYRIAGRVGYAALVAAVGCHVVWGWAQWLGFKPDQVQGRSTSVRAETKAKRRWWTLQGLSAAVVITWLAGGMGVIGRAGKVPGWVGKHYDELLRRLPYLASHV
jgi:hypothetical protein